MAEEELNANDNNLPTIESDSSTEGEDNDASSTATTSSTENKYFLKTDPDQDDKASEIKLWSFARPHMRAFHCAWWGYFIAFNLWFAAAPLLSEIRDSLKLTDEQIWTSSIAGVGGTVIMRFLLGPCCDKYGARILYLVILCSASIPTACLGLVHTATGLTVTRLCIGFAGGTFVMCQYWCTKMFTPNVVGTANATAAGWGNLGAGVAQLIMGSALFPLFKWFYSFNTEDPASIAEKAWRTVSVVPATIAFASGIVMYFISEDAPRGNFKQLKQQGEMQDVKLASSFIGGLLDVNTWLLFVQYACCFGVEMTMNNAAALYFKDQFGQSTESAAAIASIFGFLNLFARGLGGYCSDKANARAGMRGRLWVHTIVLLLEGSLILVFSQTTSLASAIVTMASFSLFVQMAEGSSYGIVPYVNPPITGSISGIVGAGGNAGAVLFSLGFRQLPYEDAFRLMGSCIIGSAFLSLFIFIRHHPGLIFDGRSPPPSSQEDDEDGLGKPSSDLALTDGSDEEDSRTSYDVEAVAVVQDASSSTHAKPHSTTSMGDFCVELSSESQMHDNHNHKTMQRQEEDQQ
ncbi:affinity nitrate transporter 2 [Seminavis robusta]|uniref:Affinity nitrate transporter 2 n=1 Tax=Seminavis robusta TaxID=568900 RepID=A0A9N8EMC6_9STRA|nr:affinity nitrate transporter 2 [Seminavis robusta]|eukprot:Sro1253_g256360.1 affinity nitrate transporter 2 (575) ;mRNA; f:24256-26083